MSVIRRSGFGRRTRRRIVGLRTALSVATADAAAVGCWFTLVVVEARTSFTAIAGLCVLVFGALLRTGIVSAGLAEPAVAAAPRRLATAVAYAAAWVCWLLVAEAVGGAAGLVVAGVLLAGLLFGHLVLGYLFLRRHGAPLLAAGDALPPSRTFLIPAALLSLGATTLLWAVWSGNSTVASLAVPVGVRTVVIEVGTAPGGVVVLGCCSFVGTLRQLHGLPGW